MEIPEALKIPEGSEIGWGQETCVTVEASCPKGHLLIACGVSSTRHDAELKMGVPIPSF